MPGAMIGERSVRNDRALARKSGGASMPIAAFILTGIVLLIHIYIVLIETVLFRTVGAKAFRIPPDRIEQMAPVMSNQGCYNLFLVAALVLGLAYPEAEVSDAFSVYGLSCVIVAGLWGGLTVSRRIFIIQALPAALALAAVLMASD
jgi:putative membrane protein